MFRSKSTQTVAISGDKSKIELLISLALPDQMNELILMGSQRNRRKRLATGGAHSISVKC